jgi:phosphoribosylamine--glycine ligase
VPIEGLEHAEARHVHVFHAGTRMGDDGVIRTSGGRVLTVVAAGRDLRHARERAYEHLARISFEGMQTRGDIALLEER